MSFARPPPPLHRLVTVTLGVSPDCDFGRVTLDTLGVSAVACGFSVLIFLPPITEVKPDSVLSRGAILRCLAMRILAPYFLYTAVPQLSVGE